MKKLIMGMALLLGVISLAGCSADDAKLELKRKDFKVEVLNKENKKASTYFKGDVDGLKIDWADFENNKLGDYSISAKKDGKNYEWTVHVVDTTAPKVSIKSNSFSFKLGEVTLDQIKSEVLNSIIVKDNYEPEILLNSLFDGFVIPTEEAAAIKLPIIVSDSSGNKSKKLEIILQFTTDGKKNNDLKETTIAAPVASNNQTASNNSTSGSSNSSNTNNGSNNGSSNNGSNNSGSNSSGSSNNVPSGGGGTSNGGNGNTTPNEPVVPPVIPPVTPERVMTTCSNFVPGHMYLGNTGLCFLTYEEAENWVINQQVNPDSTWFNYRFSIDGISNYTNWIDGEPFTVRAYSR